MKLNIMALALLFVTSQAHAFWFFSSKPEFKGPYDSYASCEKETSDWLNESDSNRMTRDEFDSICSKWAKTPNDRCELFRSSDPKWEDTIRCSPELSEKGLVYYRGEQVPLCDAIGCSSEYDGVTAFQEK